MVGPARGESHGGTEPSCHAARSFISSILASAGPRARGRTIPIRGERYFFIASSTILVLTAVVPVTQAAEIEYPYPWSKVTKILEPGDPAPGLPGETVVATLNPQIDGQDNVMVVTGVTGPVGVVIYYGSPGNLVPVAKLGDPVPGLPGVTITGFGNQPVLAEDGTVGFGASFAGPGITPGVNDGGLIVGTAGTLTLVFQARDQAPGLPGLSIKSEGAFYSCRFNEVGELYTVVELQGSGVTTDNDHLWCWWDPAAPGLGLQIMFREGDPLPEFGAGVTLGFADLTSWNDLRQFLFRGTLEGPRVTSSNDKTWTIWQQGSLTHVARKGDPAPMFGPGVIWQILQTPSGFNQLGDMGGMARLGGTGIDQDNENVIMVGPGPEILPVAREGDQVPGEAGGVEYSRFNHPYLTADQHVLFVSELRGPGTSNADDDFDWVVLYGPYDDLSVQLKDNEPVMGQADDVLSWAVGWMGGRSALNSNGYVAGLTYLAGPDVTAANDGMMWIRDGSRGLWFPVLREGDVLFGRPTAHDPVDSPFMTMSGGTDAERQSVSESGFVAISPDFAVDEPGAYLIRVPAFADFDEDGDVNGLDVGQFVEVFLDPAASPAERFVADANADELLDESDIEALIERLLQGL